MFKKTISTITILLVLFTVLSFSAVAASVVPFEEGYAEDDVVFASFNGAKAFLADLNNPEALEDACYWLADYAGKYNIRYVSFLGDMSSRTNYWYELVILQQKKTQNDLINLNKTDTEWIKEFEKLKEIGSILTDKGLPYGVSIGRADYYADGFLRDNHIASQFMIDDFIGSKADVVVDSYDSNNFAIVVNNNGVEYIVYQLELCPQQAVMQWFEKVNANHLDKRAFVFTTSFASAKGEMYTAFDPTLSSYGAAADKGDSTLTSNIVNIGKPFDGNQLWNHYLSKHDNIVMIMSANATPKTDIVVSKFENANGYEVVSVVANLESGYAMSGAYPVLAKFSEKEKTLDLRYAVPYNNKVGGYIEESKVTVSIDKMAPLAEPDNSSLLPKAQTQYNGANKKYINGYAGNLFKPNANMTRAEASTIFARLLVGSTTIPTGNTTRFTDVKAGDWYYDAIAYMDTHGFYASNLGTTYRPNDEITRAEFVELAYLASTLSATEEIVFTDVVENHPYYDAIIAAAASGLVNGYEDGSFRPDGKITRAEVVTVINRMLSLVATKETVSKDSLESVFSDISGHWAEYQILMSANDNVKSESHLNTDASLFTETPSSISFKNNLIQVYLSKKTGKIIDIIYLPTGESVVGTSLTPWFAFATTKTGATLSPSALDLVDGRLKFTFRGGYEAYFLVKAYDNFFSIEADSNISKDLWKINYGCLPFNYKASYEEGSFRTSAVAMDTRAVVSVSPGGFYSTSPYATSVTTVDRDVMGAKMAVCFSTYETHRDILKEIVDEIDVEKGMTSTMGGPYTLDVPEIAYDYVIINGFNGSNAENYARLAKEFDVEILDLHFGSTTFTTGDFNFVGARTEEEAKNFVHIDGKTFKERVLDSISGYGREIAIHSYAQGVDASARSIVTDPKFQRELHYGNIYTLRGDVSAFRTTVKTYEDASAYKVDDSRMPYSSTYGTSQYLLIDEEIILVRQGMGTSSGFMQVQRGQLGTKAAAHKDGAEIRHLSCWFGVFHPIPGSDLYWYVADQHAKAYNETGAIMIYLDAQDVMDRLVTDASERNYYMAEFVRRIIEGCNTVPLIESSNNGSWLWNAAGKKNALDYVERAIKRHKKSHYEILGDDAHKLFLSCNLGWFNFDGGSNTEYRNVYAKLLFRDDMDYMGSVSIASDFAMTPRGLNDNTEQRQYDNYNYYGVYSKLRKAGYFHEDVKKEIRNGEYEYRVIQLDDGAYAFREMYYVEKKVDHVTTTTERTGTASSPFNAHTPFIRIEQKFSTLKTSSTTLLELDETLDISSVVGTKTISSTNITDKRCLGVKVYGNGGNGAILISLKSTTSSGRYDYFIPTNHIGWKEFYLMEIDNAEYYTPYSFAQADVTWNQYATYTNGVSLDKVNTIIIGTSLNVEGVKIDDIVAYEHSDAPAKNPSVKIGSSTITFDAEIHSGDFIEYYPEKNKAYLNYFENVYNAETGEWEKNIAHVKEISFTGSVTVPKGDFSFEYNAEALTDAPLRARVKLGLQGKILKNPDDFTPPEIDMGNATLDIVER